MPELVFAGGCTVEGDGTGGFAEAVAAARGAQVVVVVVGDQAGLFGRGTVGEGNDSESLELPGVQRQLVEALLATGTPVVMVLLTGRPYAIGWALDGAGTDTDQPAKPSAVLQSFFPGEGGGLAIADILTGLVNPSGRLPVSMPRSAGAQPYTYLHPILGGPSDVTSTDSSPVRPFGFGLSYTQFAYGDLAVDASVASGGAFTAAVTVTNTGTVAGTDVVQLFGHDVQGSLPRPVVALLGYARVDLEPGGSSRVTFSVPTTRFAFSDRRMVRIVEPGSVEVWVGSHAAASHAAASTPGANLQESTGGVIANEKAIGRRTLAGITTVRAVVAITGDVHEVTTGDPRWVEVKAVAS